MKKVLFLILTAVIFQSAALFAQTEAQSAPAPVTQKIGYVDSEVIFNALPEAIKAKGDLENISKNWSAQVDSMNIKLQRDYADYQKQSATMNADKKKQVEQDLVTRDQDLRNLQQKRFGQGGDYFKKQEELFNPIKEKVIKGIQDVAKAEGLNFVFDKVGDTILLYADNDYDITYKVLDKVKRGK